MNRLLLLLSLSLLHFGGYAQSIQLSQSNKVVVTLDEVIEQACTQSVDAMMAQYSFLGSYWEFIAYKANYLPSLSLTGSLPNFDRSLVALQDPATGQYLYSQNYAMRNSLGLNLTQNLAFSGGTISLNTNLERLDQYAPDRRVSYISAPVSVILNQPIGAFNRLRWDKKIEPVKYERAKYTYLEAMEDVANVAVNMFFNQLMAQRNLEMAKQNYTNTDTLFRISQKRFEIGAVTKSDLLQLELRLLNEGLAINENQLQLNLAQARLRSYLGYKESVELELIVPERIPELKIDIDKAYELSVENTSFTYRQRVQELEADRSVAEAKAARNPQFNLYARFGLNQVAAEFGDAYRNPLDQETVRLGLNVPIFDGGVAKGRLKMSLSKRDVVEASLEKDAIDQRENLYLKVMQFNNQAMQCRISMRADSVAQQRYALSMQQFAGGRLSVLELNNSQSERNAANNKLISELYNYWNYYYSIRRMTLFDFKENVNISTDFDQIIK